MDIKNHTEKQVVVLCGHRSGSSATAGVLHYLGVDMGTTMLLPSKDNPKGYFEDIDFFNLNVRILRFMGLAWFSLPPEERIVSLTPVFEGRIKSLVESKGGIWGWKDPRTALTLPLYWNYLSNPYFVVV